MPVVNARRVIDSCADPSILAMAMLGNGVPFVMQTARFFIGQIVRHRIYPFRGVIFDVDPIFDNTEEWYQAIPEDIRPRKDQPFYHLFAENEETEYVAYCSEQNLVPDDSGQPVRSAADRIARRIASRPLARFGERCASRPISEGNHSSAEAASP